VPEDREDEMADNVVVLNEKNFDEIVTKSDVPVIVDFWAEWCGPCVRTAPIFADLAGDFQGKLKFGKVNVEENGQLAATYHIQSIPAFVVFKGGKEIHRMIGGRDKESFKSELEKLL
jgi:thioredoxin 1